jgi:hypothetical protein
MMYQSRPVHWAWTAANLPPVLWRGFQYPFKAKGHWVPLAYPMV